MPSYHGTCWKLWKMLLAALGSHSLYNSLQLSALGQPPTEFVHDRSVHKEQIPEFTNDDPTGLISRHVIGVRGVVPPNGYGFGAHPGPGAISRGPGGDPRFRVTLHRAGPSSYAQTSAFSLVFHPRANGSAIEVRAAFLRGPEITEVILSEIPCRICPFSAPAAAPRGGAARQQIKY